MRPWPRALTIGVLLLAATLPRPCAAATAGRNAMPQPKPLNNLVTELLNVPDPAIGEPYRFATPEELGGWVFVATTAKVSGDATVWVTLDGSPREKAVIVHTPGAADTQETMRCLPMGEHRLLLSCSGGATVSRLVVRAVPEIIYCKFPSNPQVTEEGAFDWAFLSKYILPHINTIVGAGDEASRPYAEQWKARGGKWIVECGLPGLSAESVTADEAYTYWAANPGLADSLLDGLIVDEFGGAISAREQKKYRAWTQAVHRLGDEGTLRGKSFYPYCTELNRYEASRNFAETVINFGQRLAFERYLREQPTEEEAQAFLNHMLDNEMFLWRQTIPDSRGAMILCLGYMSAPPESLDSNPAADYKVYMDMQFHTIANGRWCDGIYGIMEYTSSYADEEVVRWTGKLYRHYCIEGRRDRLTRDPYLLPHLQNPDFDAGAEGWTLAPAEEGSMAVKSYEGYGWLEGRWPRSRAGDNFLWMRRSAAKPNAFSQTIKALEPGRLYSLRMYTADYGELTSGKSTQQKHAVSIHMDGVELIPGRCFQHIFANCYDHHVGPFTDTSHPLWMNYHQRVFRATAPTATLTISDWSATDSPGGPTGQQLIFNFIQVQPYLAD